MLPLLSIIKLRDSAGSADAQIEARIHVQVEALHRKETRDGKPFWEVNLADGHSKLLLRAWHDSPAFKACESLEHGVFLEVSGHFAMSAAYGLEAKRWSCRELSAEERDDLLAGPPEVRERQRADLEAISAHVESIVDPRLQRICQLFLKDYADRFRRAAAARVNHHARRGGLIEHVAQMMRSAAAVASAYPALNRDLLLAGTLLHDAGKLWENSMPDDGFSMPYEAGGELLGHITIGIELVNKLWRKLMLLPEAESWTILQPPSDLVRLHLLHLLAAHHGELQFGSPVVPKTPEAWALHYIDNLDAKLEMMNKGYSGKHLGNTVYERTWPLPGHIVSPLPKFNSDLALEVRGLHGEDIREVDAPVSGAAGLRETVLTECTEKTAE